MSLAQQICDLLNEAARRDPEAIAQLVEMRAPCNNDGLLNHPTIIIGGDDPAVPMIGLVGILNGLLDIKKERISYTSNAGDNRATGVLTAISFSVMTPETHPGVFHFPQSGV